MTTKLSEPVKKALQQVLSGAMTAAEAARRYKISPRHLYRTAAYRAHVGLPPYQPKKHKAP